MLRIGLTGGIGSGKSTVAKIFQILGIPVYYADQEAKNLMNTDPALKSQIIREFGELAYINQELNRGYIASQVFNDARKLSRLNALVHPVTIAHSETWMQSQQAPYAIREAALIFESGIDSQLDYVIGVSSPALLRIQRVTSRDAITPEEVEQRIKNQMGEEEKISRCDFVILNDEQELVIPQVIALHEKLLKLSAAQTNVT